jgi:tRNA (mo5U34)-methyltransferase
MTNEEIETAVKSVPFWYHQIKLSDQVTTPGWAPLDPKRYMVPESLTGERILDVGAWDGYWTFEALKRGASWVTAIDDFSDSLGVTDLSREEQWKTFDICKSALDARLCQRLTMSVYDIEKLDFEPFDRIFCFGVIYHLRHPLLALEKLRKVCKGTIHIESAVLDQILSPYTGEGIHRESCHAEFYPTDEFGRNNSNWWVPTLKCLGAMLEAAGFRNVKLWYLTDQPKKMPYCRGFASAEV